MGTGSFAGVEATGAWGWTPHPHLVPKILGKSRAIPLLTLRAYKKGENLPTILKLLTHSHAVLLLSNSKMRRTEIAFKCCLLCFWWHDYYEKRKLWLLYRSDDRELNSEWPVTAKSTGLFVVPTPCLPTHQDAWLSASPRLSLFPRYSSTVNLVRSSPTF